MPYQRVREEPGWKEGEQQTRWSIISILRDRLRANAATGWHGHQFDLTGAIFDGGDFSGAQFRSGEVSFREASFLAGNVSFDSTCVCGATLDFAGATFTGGRVSFGQSEFSAGAISFTCWPRSRARKSSSAMNGGVDRASVSFDGATLGAGKVAFDRVRMSGGQLRFDNATFLGEEPGQGVDNTGCPSMTPELSGGLLSFGNTNIVKETFRSYARFRRADGPVRQRQDRGWVRVIRLRQAPCQ